MTLLPIVAPAFEVVTFLLLSLLNRRTSLGVLFLVIAASFVQYTDPNVPLKQGLPTSMQAAVYTNDDQGFDVVNGTLPTFQTSLLHDIGAINKSPQALVRMKAVSLNPIDYKLPLPLLPIVRWFLPNAVARDFSGVVVQTSGGCKYKVGDEIFGKSLGVLQEYAIVPCTGAYRKPKKISFVQAAAIAVAAGTSYDGLTKYGSLENKRVLIIGGSGGTGSVAVAMAKKMGAHVTAICSARSSALVRDLGADIILDYTNPNWKKELLAMPYFDHIYDTVTSPHDPDYEPITRHKLVPSGTYVAINGSILDLVRSVLSRFSGYNLKRDKYDWLLPAFTDAHFAQIIKYMTDPEKPLQIIIAEEITELTSKTLQSAFDTLKSRRAQGKIVFTF